MGQRYEDMTPDQLAAEHERLLAAREGLEAELAAVVGPDPEGPALWERMGDQIARVEMLQHLMRPFVGGAVPAWEPGTEVLHLYAVPALEGELASEVDCQAPILDEHAHLVSAVPRQWLHMTIGRIDGATDADADAVAACLDEAVPRLTAAPMKVDLTTVTTEFGTLLQEPWRPGEAYRPDQIPHTPYGAVRALKASATDAGVREGLRIPGMSGRWHISTSYCHTPGSAATLADALGTPTVRVRIGALVLAWVSQNPETPAYTWRTHRSWQL